MSLRYSTRKQTGNYLAQTHPIHLASAGFASSTKARGLHQHQLHRPRNIFPKTPPAIVSVVVDNVPRLGAVDLVEVIIADTKAGVDTLCQEERRVLTDNFIVLVERKLRGY